MSIPSRPPLSPEAAAVVRAMRAGRLSRRSMLGGAGALGLSAALAACGTKGASTSGGAATSTRPPLAKDLSDTERTVDWSNWTLYLDKDDTSKTYPTLKDFEKQARLTVNYTEDIEDNDSFFALHQAQLKGGQFFRDIITMTDWMASRLIRNGWIAKLDKDKNIPNAKNILDGLKTVDYDQGRNYSLTWQSGYTGLGWHKQRLKDLTGKSELKSVADLWDPKLKGRVEVLTEMRDTVGLIMMAAGTAVDKAFTQDKFDSAVSVLEKQLSGGQIRQFKGNGYKEDLVSGDAVAVIGWSGDIFQLNTEARGKGATSDPFGFAVPDSGGLMWSDNLMIPDGAKHKANAEVLMNYYYDPHVAAQVAAYVNYICPVKGAQAEIAKIQGVTPDIVNSPYIFPTQADLQNVHFFRSLSATEEKDFTAAFQQVLGA